MNAPSTADADLHRAGQPEAGRLGLLLFRLGKLSSGSRELFGINIFMIREVLFMPPVTPMPGGPRHVLGVVNIRGQIVPVIDLPAAVGGEPGRLKYLLVTEFNRSLQGFAVEEVDEIVRLDAAQLLPADSSGTAGGFVLGLAQLGAEEGNQRMAMVLDAARILGDLRQDAMTMGVARAPIAR